MSTIEGFEVDDTSLKMPSSQLFEQKVEASIQLWETTDLTINVLPTIGYVVRYFVLLKAKFKYLAKLLLDVIADTVMNPWNFDCIPHNLTPICHKTSNLHHKERLHSKSLQTIY